jgi:hypothetical protein
MQNLFKIRYTIIEAAESLSEGDLNRKKEIQRDREHLHFREIYNLSLTLEPQIGTYPFGIPFVYGKVWGAD